MTDHSLTPEPAQSRASVALTRVRARWSNLAGRLGLGFALAGFLVIAFAWNGSAGLDYAQGQLPYLISGGLGGLGLVVIGAAVLVADGNRRDRAALETKLDALITAVEKSTPDETAVLAAMPAPRKSRKSA